LGDVGVHGVEQFSQARCVVTALPRYAAVHGGEGGEGVDELLFQDGAVLEG